MTPATMSLQEFRRLVESLNPATYVKTIKRQEAPRQGLPVGAYATRAVV